MRSVDASSRFSNPLSGSTSLYLKQHAANPVYWYPWGAEALQRARAENKPILLSIGYSSCHWCHVMEREVFENLSIASLMNRHFINIKIDREEHPELDEIYMVARQLMTHEGGWPNHVWLTPDLKPFYAGGTFGADESYGKPSFPRLLEWLNHAWTMQESQTRAQADEITGVMTSLLVKKGAANAPIDDIKALLSAHFAALKGHYDGRGGGFFHAPKFPRETFLRFLIDYHGAFGDAEALEMALHSLRKMASGGIYDHVGCGFHRYAVDKEWYVPHFEKMLYNQAQLARVYTDAALASGEEYFSDIARSILDFSMGPFSDGSGGFYAAIDAESDGVEGAYYAWTSEQLEALLTPDEVKYFTLFYALADIPKFPGHRHPDGQVIIARKPLDMAARELGKPYVQVAAMAGAIMNKLLAERNRRAPPGLDNKIIVGWNGLMIDAYARAGSALNLPHYIIRAQKAADFMLEHAVDNEGNLRRMYAGGRAQLPATLEDYAYLVRGLLSLHRATNASDTLDAAVSLMSHADELFFDAEDGGYFFTAPSDAILLRIKNGEDSAMPNAAATMADNCADLWELTGNEIYRARGRAVVNCFLGAGQLHPEYSTMMAAAMRLYDVSEKTASPRLFRAAPDTADVVGITAVLSGNSLAVTLSIKEGWHIGAAQGDNPTTMPTQLDVQGMGVMLMDVEYPPAEHIDGLAVYRGQVSVRAQVQWRAAGQERPPLRVMLRFQPCRDGACHAVRDISLTV